jgi:phosphoserine aminotransferase
MTARADANLAAIEAFAAEHPWLTFLAADKACRSNTSVCLQLDLPKDKVKALTALLEKQQVAYDVGSYRDAPPGLRIWCGATVETEDVAILMQWLRWAYHVVA